MPVTLDGDRGTFGYVVFDDTDERRQVVRLCERCRRAAWSFDAHPPQRAADVAVVSPAGVAHAPHFDVEGETACGIDATGPAWWWRL